MDKSHGNCECCEKWHKKYIVLKRKLAETSLQIGRFLQLDQENKKLKDKLRDMHELSQTLRADCAGYQKDMCATLAELNSLKQLSSSQCAELARLNQERDEAYQAHQVAQTSLHSCQAALRQYEALIQQQQEEAKSKARPRSKTQENRVSVLEKKLQAYTQQVKQARSQRKKAMGWLRGFVELLGHPESWTSAKLRLQVERLSTLVHAEESPDEDLQCGARQLEAFLESYATSTKELTEEDLIAKAREMQVPNPLSPLPPSPQSDWMLVPDPVPFVSSYSTLLSTSSEPGPPTPWLELSPSAVPSDHMLPAPSSEQMPLECASEVVPTAPMYNVNTLTPLSELVPPPVLPTVTHNTASEVKSLDSVSLVPHLEPLQQACLSKPVLLGPSLEPLLLTSSSVGISPATPSTSTPLSSMSDPARLTQHSELAPPALLESESTPVTAISEPASPTSSFGQEPTSVTALSELASPASSLKPEPTSMIVLSEPASPAPSSEPEPTSAPPAPSLKPEPASVIVMSEPALPAASLELEPMSAPPASSLKPEQTSVIALPEPVPHASSLEPEPTSMIFLSELALSASSLKPEPTSVIALPEPAPPASSKSEPALAPAASPLEPEATSMIALSGPVPLVSSLGAEPTSVLALSELAPLAFSLKPEATLASPVISSEQEPTSVIALSEAAQPASLELEPTSVTALSKLTSPGSSLKPEPASMIALSELIPPVSSVEQETTAVVSVSELAPPVCLLRPAMPVPSPVLAIASSSSDLAPTAPLSKPVVIRPSLELGRQVSAAIPAKLMQQSKQGLPLPLLEPVSLTPTEPKLPTLTSEPAYKVCSQLKEHKVARVAIWDLVCSDHAPFLVASAVGAWPGLLSALPPGPLQRAVSYILLHSPAHSLNSTLMSQAHKVLCELGPLEEFVGDEQTLVNELLGPLLPPHRQCGDVCTTHRLALEQLCRRSPVDLLAWLLEQRLGPHLQSVLDQPHAACLVRLLGSLWKHYEKAAIKLENLLSQLESFLCHGEPAMQEAIVQALLLLPGLKGSRSAGALMHWQQQQPS
ncbi:uncharacterized protein [Dermacentor andersoni]|uniref:uncharacterized protein isoform X2 n=1 Tax=Dermacentor andersoni TaxID=34620 RepID=UPI0024169449|nr:helicase SRCAP-like isoform X2 [Dermacentor andersoni]